VGEDFERTTTLTVTTEAAPAPAPLPLATPVAGEIETPGAAPDRFSIEVCTVLPDFAVAPEPLEVRVSGALLGMVPRLEVFLGDPDLETTTRVTATAADRAAGVSLVVDAAELTCGTTLYAEVGHATAGTGTYQISAGPVLDLAFGRAGPGDSPCEIARLDEERAITELEDGTDGLAPARLLVAASRETQQGLRAGIAALPDATRSEKDASKLLKKSIKQGSKAEKLIAKTEKKAGKKPDVGTRRIGKIENRIRDALQTLDRACEMLEAGGAGLLAEAP